MNNYDPKHFFIRALEHTLKNEGGYNNDPADPGHATNLGITKETLESFRKAPVSVEDVQSLTKDQALLIYFALYWQPMSCDKIMQYPIAAAIFDMGVLFGTKTAQINAQRALNICGYSDLAADGSIGPLSLAALNEINPQVYLPMYRSLMMKRVTEVIAAHPLEGKFKQGWEHRLDRLLTLVS